MRVHCIILSWLLAGIGPASASPIEDCPAGNPVAAFELTVRRFMDGPTLPLRHVNSLLPADRISYRPIRILPDIKEKDRDKARVSLFIIPAGSEGSAKEARLLEVYPALGVAEWHIPVQVSVIALIFGVEGLDDKKVSSIVRDDDDLLALLADYADRTAEVEDLLDSFSPASSPEAPEWTEDLGPEPTSSTDRLLVSLIRALNPTALGYDPLASGVRANPGMAGTAANAFFDNAGSLLPGGGLVSGLKGWLFPDTEFHSAFSRSDEQGGMTLCVKRGTEKSRTKEVYLWAHRMPDAPRPDMTLSEVGHLRIGHRGSVPVKLQRRSAARSLSRVRNWNLVPAPEGKAIPVDLRPSLSGRALEMDLRNTEARPGTYRLAAMWDWEPVSVSGEIHLHAEETLKTARLDGASQNRLTEGTGWTGIELTGGDFQFVRKVGLRLSGTRGGEPRPLEFMTPPESPDGRVETLKVFVNANEVRTGDYLLVLEQAQKDSKEIPVRVLPPHPEITNIPIRVNVGENEQKVMLRGTGLHRIRSARAGKMNFTLSPSDARSESPGERELTVRIAPGSMEGESIELILEVDGLEEPLKIPGGIHVAGPLPHIRSARGSIPEDLTVQLREREIPSGAFTSFSMEVDNLQGLPSLHLDCSERAHSLGAQTLRLGERREWVRFGKAGEARLILSLDPASVGLPGCELAVSVETESAGRSEAYILGKVVRIPRIDGFTLTDEKLAEMVYAGVLKGLDLETVEKTGWNAVEGYAVPEMPKPLSGEAGQSLKIALPWPPPSPKAPLYIWLRGETEGRPTRARY